MKSLELRIYDAEETAKSVSTSIRKMGSGLTYPFRKGGCSLVISEERAARTTLDEPVLVQRLQRKSAPNDHSAQPVHEAYNRTRQAQSFDSNSRWVPILSQTKRLTSPNKAKGRRHGRNTVYMFTRKVRKANR